MNVKLPSNATLAGCIAMICAFVIGLDAWRTWSARETAMAAAQVETANMGRSLAQHAHDMLATADTLLVGLRLAVEADGGQPASPDALQHVVATQIATVPMLRDLMVFGADGIRTVNSGRPAPVRESILDRVYFQYHATHPDRGVHVAEPVRGKLDGTWILPVSRRIDRPDGSFAGIVLATFAASSFTSFYSTFALGQDGFAGLSTTNAVVIARYPVNEAQLGRPIDLKAIYGRDLVAEPVGEWHAASPIDGVDRIGHYRVVENYPLMVVVGRSRHEMLEGWRNDAWFHFSVSLVSTAFIAVLGMRFTSQLRLRDRAERALQRRERQYRLLADNSTDLILQLGPGLDVVYASPASRRVLGYGPSELAGRHVRDLTDGESWPGLNANLETILQRGSAPALSYRVQRRDRRELWVEASGRRLDDGSGLVLVVRDITQRRQAEMQLRQAQRMEALGQLTAGVAHDFNNLLQVQFGALELLQKELHGRDRAVRLATTALDAAEHAAKLTHSLLSFSRQQVLDPKPVPVSNLLARLETILSRTLGPRILLTLTIEPGVPALFADQAQVEAALLNLALNARDAMPDGGALLIAAARAPAGPGQPCDLRPGEHVLITVADDGTGMSPETLAQACEPFFTTKGIGKGSGLGLAMVQGFVRQSGGAIRFDSVEGHGTRVELWLPAASADTETPAMRGPERVGQGRVLLVDDVPDVLAPMAEILEGVGFTVVTAPSAEAALERLREGPAFDALVTDFAMPGMNGVELIRLAAHVAPGLPAMLLTGYVETELTLGLPPGTTTLRKPAGGDVLIRHVCELTETRRGTVARVPTSMELA